MPRPWRIRYAGAKYHLTSRGNGRNRIFSGAADYTRFLTQLDEAMERDQVILYAYVLMPNHYHLMVETPLGNVPRFMQRLNTAYSMYFRYKHARAGHCLQGRYGAKLVGGDEYIMRLTRYIHLNPVKVRNMEGRSRKDLQKYLDNYRWSSYPGYAGVAAREERIDYRWLDLMPAKTRRGRTAAYRRYLNEMLEKEDEDFKKADAASRYALGDELFRAGAEQELREKRMERAVTGDILWPESRMPSIAEVEQAVLGEFKITREDLRSHGHRAGDVKAVAVALCCDYTGRSQREVSRYFGYSNESTVGRHRRSLSARLVEDPGLAKRVARLRARLHKCYNLGLTLFAQAKGTTA
jgi:REP element-mobilizing transposase RayT